MGIHAAAPVSRRGRRQRRHARRLRACYSQSAGKHRHLSRRADRIHAQSLGIHEVVGLRREQFFGMDKGIRVLPLTAFAADERVYSERPDDENVRGLCAVPKGSPEHPRLALYPDERVQYQHTELFCREYRAAKPSHPEKSPKLSFPVPFFLTDFFHALIPLPHPYNSMSPSVPLPAPEKNKAPSSLPHPPSGTKQVLQNLGY